MTAFIHRHQCAWDLAMGVLTVPYVILAFRGDSGTGLAGYIVLGLAAVFLLEFGARCYDSSDRGRYFRAHWLDLITAIPIPDIPGLRMIRLLRLLRFLKVGMLVRGMLLSRNWGETSLIWPTLVLFWIASALALWSVERDTPGSNITTFPDAMTAAFLTAATLGFGKHALPVTQDGQIIAAVIVFFALGLWGFASSRLTAMWLNARGELAREEMISRDDLDAMREELSSLTHAVLHRPSVSTTSTLGERSRAESEAELGRPST
ncbi:MAG: ion transporter [Candidatus Dormibacteraeota bacterium]|uniref:Ion transporter n=1 Tax=Candidatus Dormiibacter inghamiae TaxID=3127013 RepID=A0A934KAQ6_9BACT|nr:ion transporter [Candidatus Dormibacteraeota bacterium]